MLRRNGKGGSPGVKRKRESCAVSGCDDFRGRKNPGGISVRKILEGELSEKDRGEIGLRLAEMDEKRPRLKYTGNCRDEDAEENYTPWRTGREKGCCRKVVIQDIGTEQ